MKSAVDFLNKAAEIMEERGKQYDQPTGERSMGKAVSAFNVITGQDLSEAEGWLLLQILKDVRQWQRPAYHADSAEDCVAYAALKAEALEASAPDHVDIDPAVLANVASFNGDWQGNTLVVDSFEKSPEDAHPDALTPTVDIQAKLLDSFEHHAKRLTRWMYCMSGNDSYFGEPAGLVKSVAYDLNRLIGSPRSDEPSSNPCQLDWPDETRRQDASAEDEAFAAIEASQPRIDSGPMWMEWCGADKAPCNPGMAVEVRFRNGRAVTAQARELIWDQDGSACDIMAWRNPWPADDRIEAIGQNGPTGEHYASPCGDKTCIWCKA